MLYHFASGYADANYLATLVGVDTDVEALDFSVVNTDVATTKNGNYTWAKASTLTNNSFGVPFLADAFGQGAADDLQAQAKAMTRKPDLAAYVVGTSYKVTYIGPAGTARGVVTFIDGTVSTPQTIPSPLGQSFGTGTGCIAKPVTTNPVMNFASIHDLTKRELASNTDYDVLIDNAAWPTAGSGVGAVFAKKLTPVVVFAGGASNNATATFRAPTAAIGFYGINSDSQFYVDVITHVWVSPHNNTRSKIHLGMSLMSAEQRTVLKLIVRSRIMGMALESPDMDAGERWIAASRRVLSEVPKGSVMESLTRTFERGIEFADSTYERFNTPVGRRVLGALGSMAMEYGRNDAQGAPMLTYFK
jgi:hypothetical protein